jgi:amidase
LRCYPRLWARRHARNFRGDALGTRAADAADNVHAVTADSTIVDLPAHALSAAIHTRDVSCREVMEAYLERIDVVNPMHNAIVSLRDREALLDEAAAHDDLLITGDSKGWMHGFPHAVKDVANAVGLPTTLGSRVLKNFHPKRDSLVVERMRAEGCIFIGKTNVPEFGLGSHTFNEVFGTTTNAYDATKSAGGSSGGAAVGLATHMLPVADGSDFGGSLRNPAAWNNVFGFRPSQGRVPMWPTLDAYVSQLATEGPMGRTVRDVALLLETMSGSDDRCPLSLPEIEFYADHLHEFTPSQRRIGWLGDLNGYLAIEPGILDVCEQALTRLEGIGCSVEPTSLGYDPQQVWDKSWMVWRRWLVASNIGVHLAANPANRELIKPEALWEYDSAQTLTGTECLVASQERTSFYRHLLNNLFDRFDYLALPAAQLWPFDATLRWPSDINGKDMDTYHRWMEVAVYATLAGLPSISVPAGFSARGLPMGLQIIGRPRADLAVLQIAHAYETAAHNVLTRRPEAIRAQ